MIKVTFTDEASGRWGFTTGVCFALPPNATNPGGDLILEVSMKSEVFDCAGPLLRNKPDMYNYPQPLIENFGPFANPPVPIYDFHHAFGHVDPAYNAGEKIRITITGSVWLQKTKDSNPKGQIPLETLKTPPDRPGIALSEVVVTDKKATVPGIIQHKDPDKPGEGSLVGQPLTKKTQYTYVYNYQKCGPQKDWAGTTDTTTSSPIAFVPDLDEEDFLAFSDADLELVSSIVADLETGPLTLLQLSSSAGFQQLLTTPGLGAKSANYLVKATPFETVVLSEALRNLRDLRAVRPLIEALGRFPASSPVNVSAAIADESWIVDDVIQDALRSILAQPVPLSATLPNELVAGGDKSLWLKWFEAGGGQLPDQIRAIG
ncbi:MAG: hypothetical protein ACT4QB_16055 [Gammaproteobacteria bacterium]